jgi:hypothetical protein
VRKPDNKKQSTGDADVAIQDLRTQPKVSRLGSRLRDLSDKALASGIETLSNEQIHQLIAETRGT